MKSGRPGKRAAVSCIISLLYKQPEKGTAQRTCPWP